MKTEKEIIEQKKKDFKNVIEHLQGLVSGKVKPKDPMLGVCNEFNDFVGHSKVTLMYPSMFLTWDNHSGDNTYPVPHPDGAKEGFLNTKKSLWKGQQGELRKDLCKHLVKCFKEELKKL